MSAKAVAGERLPYLIGKLKAPRIGERLERIAEQARREEWPYERFLEALLEAEVFARDASGARQRIRSAGFPARKTLEDFDFAAQPSAERPLLMHLAQLTWVAEHSNVLFFGPPGTGKTHCESSEAMERRLKDGMPPRGHSVLRADQARPSGGGRHGPNDSLTASACPGLGYVCLSLPAPTWTSPSGLIRSLSARGA